MEEKKVDLGMEKYFPMIFTIIFMVLKLCGVISWSWWWVVSPLWITGCVVLLVFFIAMFVVVRNKE